ncbi:MAG: hypothetical protein EAX96_01770 [Candidatus Lokiarchaeota archaeon]|nr:hypothetical protein [Candidatus Lokiarchaeota archaeon]
MKDIQNLFMWNMVSFLLFYIGISISLMSFDTIIATSLIFFIIIGFILISLSYLIYIAIYVITQTKKLNKNVEIAKCTCGGTNQLYLKDILIQFWFVSIFIYVIVHIIFQFAFILYESYIPGSKFPSPAYEIPSILIFLGLFIFAGSIFSFINRKKKFNWEHHKSPKAFIQTFQVFFITISCTLIANTFINPVFLQYNHLLFYEIFNKLSLVFPAFVLNAVFYILLKKILNNHKSSMINQILIGFIFIIVPYFIWMIILLFIQDIWPFIYYGILSGFILGFLFIIGIDNIVIYFKKEEKLDYRYRIVIMLISAIFTYLKIFFSFPLINIIYSFIFIIISYVGLHLEFFLKGDKTYYFGKLSKNDYPYYIFLAFIFLIFFASLETLFNSSTLINNMLFVQHSVLFLLFQFSLLIGMLSPIFIIVIKNWKELKSK